MIKFDEVTYLKNLKADTETGPWVPVAISASTPCPSSAKMPRHAYVTTAGILIHSAKKQVAIRWSDLFVLIESVAPEMKCLAPVVEPSVPPRPAPTAQPAALSNK